jgi:hypothetical protein
VQTPPTFPAPQAKPTVAISPAWRRAMALSWLLVAAALIVVAVTGRNVGKPAWWIGPVSNPTPFFVWALPFIGPAASIVATFRIVRWAHIIGLASAALIGVVAVFDINNSPGIALIEFVIAVAAALIAIASFAGRTKSTA